MSKTYSFGPDTDYSVRRIIDELGYDFEALQLRSADDRFDFAISIIPEVKAWFNNLREQAEAPRIVRSVLHALNVEVPNE